MKTTSPSLEKLLASGLCDKSPLGAEKCAQLVRDIIHGKVSLEENEQFPQTAKWFLQCHNPPKSQELKMSALNELLGCYGVEAIGDFNNYPPVCHFEYLNTGDTYSATIIRFPGGRYVVSSWGDEVERLERKGVTIP